MLFVFLIRDNLISEMVNKVWVVVINVMVNFFKIVIIIKVYFRLFIGDYFFKFIIMIMINLINLIIFIKEALRHYYDYCYCYYYYLNYYWYYFFK